MERHTALLLIAIALAAYGGYHAFYAIAMLPAPASPLLLLAFALNSGRLFPVGGYGTGPLGHLHSMLLPAFTAVARSLPANGRHCS